MIPNATTFLSQLPGTRVTAVSGGVTAPLCIREAIIKRGNMSDSGLSAQPVASLLFLTLAFTKPRDVADLITIDSVPAIVTGTELVMFGQIIRAHMLLLSDSCTFDGAPLACQINAISAAAEMFSTGIQQDETETLFTHTDLLPEGSDLPTSRDPIIMPDGSRRNVLFVSTDNTGRVLSIHTTKRGAA